MHHHRSRPLRRAGWRGILVVVLAVLLVTGVHTIGRAAVSRALYGPQRHDAKWVKRQRHAHLWRAWSRLNHRLPDATAEQLILSGGVKRIPRVIHQTVKDKDALSEQVKGYRATWATQNPTWEMKLWDDAECALFVATEFPEYLAAYAALPHNVERADFFRYMVVLRYGGVYADIDVECRRPLDPLVQAGDTLIVGWENEFASNAEAFTRTYSRTRQLEQWVFMGAPGHPVLRRICDHVDAHATTVFPGHVDRQVLERTGPGAWTDAVLSWGRDNGFTHSDNAARAKGGSGASKHTWDVRLVPMVLFSAQPSVHSVDGVSEKAPEVVVVHHFKGSWKIIKTSNVFSYAWRQIAHFFNQVKSKTFDPLCTLMHVPLPQPPPLVLLDEEITALEGANLPANPVSVESWGGPAFTVMVRKADANSSRYDGGNVLKWGLAQEAFMREVPSRSSLLLAALAERPESELLVSCGAGVGTAALAAAANGRQVMAWENAAEYKTLLAESIAINGFGDKVTLNPAAASCDHLSSLRSPVGVIVIGASVDPAATVLGAATLLRSASPPAAILVELRAEAKGRAKTNRARRETRERGKEKEKSFVLPAQLAATLGRLRQAGYVSMFHAGRACEQQLAGWSGVEHERAASAAGEAGSQEEEPPSWCVLCAGRQGDYGDFIHAVEAHGGGGQASVVLFHRSAGVDDAAVWCSALEGDA